MRDLVGELPFVASFPQDPQASGFDNDADALIASAAHLDEYARVAEQIAAKVSPAALAPCPPGDRGCGPAFVASFGRRAFRRPLTDEEAARYLGLYQGAADGGHEAGVRLVIEAMLQSPAFLYRTELGDGTVGTHLPLTGWELAAQLSFSVTGTPPDERLAALAEAGALTDSATRGDEARRLMATPQGRKHLRHFLASWLGVQDLDRLAKVAAQVPAFTAAVRDDVAEEMRRFLDHAIAEQGGSIEHLFGATSSFASARMIAAVYGDDARPEGADGRVTLDPERRQGVLSLPGFLAAHASVDRTSPVDRGLFVRLRLLCNEIPSPPADLDIKPINADDAGRTTRQKLEQHVNQPICHACHRYIDPIGLGFESMDTIGRFRTKERDFPVDSRGELTGTDVDGPFEGPAALSRRLLGSRLLRACFVTHVYRFLEGRVEPSNSCERQAVLDRVLATGGTRLDDVVAALAEREGFAVRTPAP